MSSRISSERTESTVAPVTAWFAVMTLAATSLVLSTGEFLPPSLLPAMASSLDISEGQAGQAVTATAFAGLLTAPLIGTLAPRLDRRLLLSALALAAAASNIAVAVASEFTVLLVARLVLGIAIGGFWAMSLAVAARLSAPHHAGRSIALVNLGATVATVAGVPFGILIGTWLDWRAAFIVIGILAGLVALMLIVSLPAVPADDVTGARALADTIRTPGLTIGLVGHTLTMLSSFAAFTYIRPALALNVDLTDGSVAALVAAYGAGSVAGGVIAGSLVDQHLRVLRYGMPFVLAASIGCVLVFAQHLWVVTTAVVLWGAVFGGWLIVVSAWVGRVVPSRLEAASGLVVAGYQLAIALGAGVGGVLIDGAGIEVTLALASAAALAGGVLFGTAPSTARSAGADLTSDAPGGC
jgi:predicted MFS family arabinose efflux permease